MEVAAVNIEIRAAIKPFARIIEENLIHRLAGVPGATDVAMWFDAGRHQGLLDAETAQHLHHIGAQDDTRADAGEGRCLLIDFDRKAGALEEAGCAQPTEAGANDGNTLLFLIHRPALASRCAAVRYEPPLALSSELAGSVCAPPSCSAWFAGLTLCDEFPSVIAMLWR